jgi:hypothetical protein
MLSISGNYNCFINQPWNDILGDGCMTFLQFNQLSRFDKFAAILEHGVNIGDRRSKYANVILYQVFSFYIEVYYDPSQNEIVQLKSFAGTDLLDPYIKSITVESLLQ